VTVELHPAMTATNAANNKVVFLNRMGLMLPILGQSVKQPSRSSKMLGCTSYGTVTEREFFPF
jgi:hypothetical protein